MYLNPYLVIPFVTWVIAQGLKFALSAARGKLDFKYLYASGGMPSAHSAVVCSLAVTSFLLDGPTSHLFGLTAVVAGIVMYDSFGVRRSTGEQAAALNMLIDSLDRDRIGIRQPHLRLREILGHTPFEVAVGAVLGVFMAALFNISHLSAQLNFLSATPGRVEAIIYFAIFAVLLVGGLAARLWLGRRYRRSAAIRALAKQILILSEVIGWPGLIAAFGQYENLPYVEWRVWPILLLALLGIWKIYLLKRFWVSLPAALAEERDTERKNKWLKLGLKRSRKKRK